MYVRSHDSGTVGVDRTEHGKIRDGQLSQGYQCFVCTLRSDMMDWSSGTPLGSVHARLYLTPWVRVIFRDICNSV